MRELTGEERLFMASLMRHKPQKKGRYYNYVENKKSYKRSRIIMQLFLNKKLEMWEHVHHKNENTEDDSVENLEILKDSEHTSHHHAGKRRNR